MKYLNFQKEKDIQLGEYPFIAYKDFYLYHDIDNDEIRVALKLFMQKGNMICSIFKYTKEFEYTENNESLILQNKSETLNEIDRPPS